MFKHWAAMDKKDMAVHSMMRININEFQKLPNLCDPNKGQLFENYDKYEDFDEFDNVYKDQILFV